MLRATIVSVNGENDQNLIKFIASTVETMRDQMVTKEELVAVKDQMATKKELAAVKDQMATRKELALVKDDLDSVKAQMATRKELAAVKDQMATKDDLAHLELKLDTKMTVIRGDIEHVQLRLDSIDHALNARMGMMETDISRMRSVLYLLVKDKPDMLRLLGQPTHGESRPQG